MPTKKKSEFVATDPTLEKPKPAKRKPRAKKAAPPKPAKRVPIYPLGERKAFGLDLLDTVTYFLRPYVVSQEVHRANQKRAAESFYNTIREAHRLLSAG